MSYTLIIFLSLLASSLSLDDSETFNRTFSKDFLLGFATAAYQIEGGWDEDGKGESIWDRLVHSHPEYIADGSNGDVAADSYHKVREDVLLLRDVGAKTYRFSIAWSRVLPTGLPNKVNQKGIDYYNTLIGLLRAYDIEPLVTMYHWDMPQYLQDLGGWLNPNVVDYFREYARLLYNSYGDRVTYWLTFNEPQQFCLNGYGDEVFAPRLNIPGIADYQCGHNVIKSHAAAYRLYYEEFKERFNGKIGIALAAGFTFSVDDDPKNIEAAERNMAFDIGWFSQPIFSKQGNYPDVMIQRIANRSILEGYSKSRLPEFTQEEIEYIRGTGDFFGVNHYTSMLANYSDEFPIDTPSQYTDKGTIVWTDDSWPVAESDWLKVIPEGLRRILNWVYDQYDIEMIVTECGYSDKGELDDEKRIDYFKQYLTALFKAAYDDNVPVFGFTAWSLLDNFEWLQGYTQPFGIYSVDYTSSSRNRTAKQSALYFSKVAQTNCLLETEECGE